MYLTPIVQRNTETVACCSDVLYFVGNLMRLLQYLRNQKRRPLHGIGFIFVLQI